MQELLQYTHGCEQSCKQGQEMPKCWFGIIDGPVFLLFGFEMPIKLFPVSYNSENCLVILTIDGISGIANTTLDHEDMESDVIVRILYCDT